MIAGPANSATTEPKREERPERDPHLPRRLAVPGQQHDAGTSAASMPIISATGTVLPSAAPISERELHVAHSHALRIGERRGEEEARRRRRPRSPTRGWDAGRCCAASTIAAAGSTIRFGMTRYSRSVAETATRTRQKNAATAASAVDAELPDAAGDEQRRDELHRRVARRDPRRRTRGSGRGARARRRAGRCRTRRSRGRSSCTPSRG